MSDESTTTASDAADFPDSAETSAETGSSKARRSRGRRLGGGLIEIVMIVVISLLISAGLRHFVGQMFVIPSQSMQNTLQVGDRVVVSKVSDFHRGSVVVFKDPGNWVIDGPTPRTGFGKVLETIGILPSTSANYVIKRVIGLPGDDVKCCDKLGRVTVNGVALDETSYLYSENGVQVSPANVPFEVIVPAGRLFVMGDHRNESGDSRCHLADLSVSGQPVGASAFVPESNVVGPAVAIVAPLDRIASLPIPSTFNDIPAAAHAAPAQASITPAGVGC